MKKLLIAVMLTAFSLNVSAAEDFALKLENLKSLNIILGDPDGNLRLGDSLTIAEAAAISCRLMGIEPSDAEDGFWASEYINAAKQCELLDTSEALNPDAYMTVESTAKMLVSLLGYEPLAERKGGYMTVAAELALIRKDVKQSDFVTREDIVNMAHRTLDIPLMYQTSFGETAEYAIMDGNNDRELVTLRKQLEE